MKFPFFCQFWAGLEGQGQGQQAVGEGAHGRCGEGGCPPIFIVVFLNKTIIYIYTHIYLIYST